MIQLPLGIGIALMLRRARPRAANLMLMCLAIPLVVPTNMVAGLWLALLRPEGLGGQALTLFNLTLDYKFTAAHTWGLILVVDTWHWLGLVVILAYAGLSSISPAYYQAAAIDSASRSGRLSTDRTSANLWRLMDRSLIEAGRQFYDLH